MADFGLSSRRKVVLAGSGAVLLVSIAFFIFMLMKPGFSSDIPGVRLPAAPAKIPEFSLIDHQGRPFSGERLMGKWTLATIGFVYCPDICPTTLSQMAAVFKQLETTPSGVSMPELVFLSVDPFRDSPEILGKYVGYFHPKFTGVSGKPADIQQLVAGLGLGYSYADAENDHIYSDILHKPAIDDYVVVHSTGVLFFNPRAELVATMTPPFVPDEVIRLLSELRAYYGD